MQLRKVNTERKTPEIEKRSVTSRYHGSKISGSQQHGAKQRWRQRQRKWQKSNRFILAKKKKTTTTHHAFLYISLHGCNMIETYLFHAPALRSWWTHRENVLFLFRNLDTGLSDSTPEKSDNIWQIKWNWIRSMKTETLWIHFLSELSVCCHPEILLPCQRDKTTPLLYSGLEIISRESPDTMTGQIHFSSVTCRFWPVKFVR